MRMSHMSSSALAQLQAVAFEVGEVFGERGHNIDGALDRDPAFRASTSTRSELTRSLVKDAVRAGASRMGIDHEYVTGGALEMRFDIGARIQVIRVKKAKRLANGELVILTNNSSSWGTINEDLLIPEEPWVFGYIASSSSISELFLAPVLDVTEGTPGRLVLGTEFVLDGQPGPMGSGFQGDDGVDLPGFEEDDSDQGEIGIGG